VTVSSNRDKRREPTEKEFIMQMKQTTRAAGAAVALALLFGLGGCANMRAPRKTARTLA
jgi:hypothetical protein